MKHVKQKICVSLLWLVYGDVAREEDLWIKRQEEETRCRDFCGNTGSFTAVPSPERHHTERGRRSADSRLAGGRRGPGDPSLILKYRPPPSPPTHPSSPSPTLTALGPGQSDREVLWRVCGGSGSGSVKPGSTACLWVWLLSAAVAFLCTEARTTPSPLITPSNATCSGNSKCRAGIILPIWYPEDPSMGDKIARVIVYFVAMIYMFLGVSIISDRFMAAIEVITSQERELVIKKPNGETTTTTIRVWNETVSNLTLMALGSSTPEILLTLIEVCGHGFVSGELGPATIVGSAAFNMFVIIGLCVSVVPQGEVRKVKHLRVFFVTAGWSVFAYIWLYMILAVFSPNEVQVWEGLLTLAFFPICVFLAWIADRRLLFFKFMHKKYHHDKHRGTEGERSKGIEMDGKMVNSHFMDGSAASNLIGLIESKEVDESRRDMIRILKDLKQKHPEKELDQLVEMANYYALSHQQKSRAFYRIQATRMMTGAGNILKKHVAEQAKKSVSIQEIHVEEPEEYVSRIAFDPAVYQCLENCGAAILTVIRRGGDINKTIYVDYKTEDGSANAGADYEFSEGTVVFKPGEMFREINIGIIDDDIFEEDEHFFVRLGNLRVLETEDEVLSPNSLPYPKAMLGFPAVATVTILDDDHSGIFTFESGSMHVSESIGIMEVKVLRTSGARGTVIVPFRTVEAIAKGGGEDFEDNYGELEFKNDETWPLGGEGGCAALRNIDLFISQLASHTLVCRHQSFSGPLRLSLDPGCRTLRVQSQGDQGTPGAR
ncbi:hypothetical protein F7725_008450 [Dissostichus mawsoni]|uniref:Calx-beta domain-containing protein n=1 Tax=Dissostichus mawsoni TaxID=36200 RepID=A0A7J5Y9P4_DISMA|nr:hypothetical protein F7725_008450 [Dissostichus mawsoni]